MVRMGGRPRSDALGEFVEAVHYQEGEIPLRRERMLPTGGTYLILNLYEDEFRTYKTPESEQAETTHGAAVAGPRAEATVIDTREQRHLIRVHFRMGGAAAFFRTPLREMKNRFVGLAELWGRDGRLLRERVLEAPTPEAKLQTLETALLEQLRATEPREGMIGAATRALERGLAVREVQRRLGLQPKTLVRRFDEHIGMSPKTFSRVRRLQRVLGSMKPGKAVDWAEVAAHHGYTDQPHLIHDFRELTGMSPSRYRPSGERNHVPVTACAG